MHATRQQGTHKTFEDIPDDLMFKFSHLHMKARLRAKSVKESFAISFTCRRQCRSKRQKGAISFLRNRIENVNKRDTRSSLLFCPADITERCIFIFILEKCDLSALKSISFSSSSESWDRRTYKRLKSLVVLTKSIPSEVFERKLPVTPLTTDDFQLCVADLLGKRASAIACSKQAEGARVCLSFAEV